MCRRNLFFSSVDSLSRCREPLELPAEGLDVVRTADGDRTAEVAFAELANRAVDLAHRPADQQQEQHDENESAGDQGRGLPGERVLRGARILLELVQRLLIRRRMPWPTSRAAAFITRNALDDHVDCALFAPDPLFAPERSAQCTSFEIDVSRRSCSAMPGPSGSGGQRREALLEGGLVAVVEVSSSDAEATTP